MVGSLPACTGAQCDRSTDGRWSANLPRYSRCLPKWLVKDEFFLFKDHRYAKVVLDADSRQMLSVGEGRGFEAIRPFFTWLGGERCRAVEVVAMDMNTACDRGTKQCSNASRVHDLFHVIAKYGREVIDQVRVDEANRLRDQSKLRQIVK